MADNVCDGYCVPFHERRAPQPPPLHPRPRARGQYLIRPEMTKPDVIVVGAGVVGCSIAYHLGLLGAKVTVFDKAGVCEGMTSRSGAMIRMHYTFAPEAALAWKSLDYFANWDERVGGDCRFVKTGFAIVVGPSNADRLRENVGMLQALGINTRIIEAEELTKIEPEIESRDAALAAYE